MTVFPIPISDDKLDFLTHPGTGYAAKLYMAIWSNPIVMQARVNQSTFAVNIDEITFDQIDTVFNKGAYTDAIEGYIAYFSRTNDIRANYESFRLRTDSTATALFIEMTSADVNDNDYIFVVKDVQFRRRKARLNFIDSDIPYQAPPPAISGIDTFYFEQITSTGGSVDLVITPSATVIASGAAVTGWTLTLDAGSEIAFNAGTGAATIRYDTPGDYMPRWTVTDDNGNSQWFTPHVKIAGTDVRYVINLSAMGANVSHSIEGGSNATVPFFDGIQNVIDGTFVAIVLAGTMDVGGSKVVFVGRVRFENNDHVIDRESGAINTVAFDLQGISSQMAALGKNPSWIFQNKTAPSNFNQLKDATTWRVVASYLAFFTTFNNVHGLSFDDTSADFQLKEFLVAQSNYLDALKLKLNQINAVFDYSLAGQSKIVRHAFFLDDSDRNALPTIANWEKQNYETKQNGGNLWSLEHSHLLRLSSIIGGGAWYSTTNGNVTILVAYSPAVVAAGGQEQTELNGQILVKDQSKTDAGTELKQRVGDAFSALQDLDTFSPEVTDIFATLLSPSAAAWHTHTIERVDNIRGYDLEDKRSLLTEISININVETGRPMVSPRFQFEPERLQYQTLLADPPVAVGYNRPVLLNQPSLLNFPELPGLNNPTGAVSGVDDQPYSQDDTDGTTQPKDPTAITKINSSVSGFNILVWSETTLHYATDFGYNAGTDWQQSELPLQTGHDIKQAIWDRYSLTGLACYAISNNDTIATPETRVYSNLALTEIAGWAATDLDDMLATMVNSTDTDHVIVYGKFGKFIADTWQVDLLSIPPSGEPSGGLDGGSGVDLVTSNESGSHGAPLSNRPGVYDSVRDIFVADGDGDSGGGVNNSEWPMPPGTTLTRLRATFRIFKNPLAAGKDKTVSIVAIQDDGTITLLNTDVGGFGTSAETLDCDSGAVSIADITKLVIHCSSTDDFADGGANTARTQGITIEGGSVEDYAGTRYSEDTGASFAAPKTVGLMDMGDGSFTRRNGGRVLAAKNEQVKRAIFAGQPFAFNADQGDTAGQFAKALLKTGTDDDYLLAPDAGGVGLYRIVSNVRTDITPNDGASDGFAVGPGALATWGADYAFFLADFGGTVKLAYSDDIEETTPTWSFNTEVTNDAIWIDVNAKSAEGAIQVVVADGSVIKYSVDGAVNFVDRPGPAADLKGVELL